MPTHAESVTRGHIEMFPSTSTTPALPTKCPLVLLTGGTTLGCPSSDPAVSKPKDRTGCGSSVYRPVS